MRQLITLILALTTSLLMAQTSTDWYRYAAISPNGEQIVFTYKGDLYLVSSQGGEATPLTFHEAHDYKPVWSNDGSKIAFASDRYGNMDVFVIDSEGGKAKRLSYHSADEEPYSFSPDNTSIIFGAARLDDVNHRQYPRSYLPEVYTVPANGGKVSQLWTIPAEDIQVNKEGTQYIYHDIKGGENYWRKHHESSVTRDIWKYDVAEDKHTQLTTFYGEDRTPVYNQSQDAVYYLSEESGTFNVHKFSLDTPEKNTQLTKFDMHPVRFLSMADNGTLCFTHNGDIYTMNDGGESVKIDISVTTEAKENDYQLVNVSGNVSEMAISPDGKEIAYIVRGEVFVSSVEGDFNKRITNTPAEEAHVTFSADGKEIIYASERNAKWGIYKTTRVNKDEPYFFISTVLKEEALIVNENENYQPEVSPDGKEIAFIENKRFLKVMNLETKTKRTLLTDAELYYMGDGDQYFKWSPDSKWLLVSYTPVMSNDEVVLVKADGSKAMVNLTESGYGDYSAKWVNNGKQILWFSNRYGMRSHANSGSKELDVLSLFLTQEAWDEFNMSKDEFKLQKELKEKNDKKDEGEDDKKKKKKGEDDEEKDEVKTIEIDWEGISDRSKRLTIHSSRVSDAVLSKDGETLYYITRFEKNAALWSTELRTRETTKVMDIGGYGGSLVWDKKMENLFLLASGRISKIDVKGKSKESVSIGGEITFNATAEREHMFDHVWKRTESMFYITGYHGADWYALRENYEPKLQSIGNDREFAELLSEMLGELNVSHCGARYRANDPKGDETASLGIFIDYDYAGQGLKIAEIINNGPLDKKKFDVKAGMVIQKINGETITSDVDYAKYLNRLEDKYTLLTIFDPVANKTFDITIKPVSPGTESSLLYDRWVKANESDVEKLSGGKLGYVHIPGMNDGAYRETYERALGKYFDTEGLIVDTRFNGGGDLVGDITMFLTGETFMTYAIESRDLGYEPGYRWTKPNVAMINEANYSDGHCFACAYQDLGIGKIIGMPTPGTCSFAGWETLQNGSVMWGSVPVSAKNKAGEWLENNETVPEVKIKNMPGVIDNGRDQQLEAAVETLLEELK